LVILGYGMPNRLCIGIDASNIRAGGGLTHLASLLESARPLDASVERIVVWGGEETLRRLPASTWLDTRQVPSEGGLARRFLFQQHVLPGELDNAGCHALLAPGGIVSARVRIPSVVISQNLLPFEPDEAKRFGSISAERLRYALIRRAQVSAIRRAAGVIFLTNFAQSAVLRWVPGFAGRTAVIPHGVDERFGLGAGARRRGDVAFRVLYVSVVNFYKHQDSVATAAAMLRRRGIPVTVDFIGPAHQRALRGLEAVLRREDPAGEFLRYRGAVPFKDLHEAYHAADAFVFASSCENLPNILLEAMAAALPIACSDRGPMPEVLGDAGVYFDPERPESICEAMAALYDDPKRAEALGRAAHDAVEPYTWSRCADKTLAFVRDVVESMTVS